MVKMINKDTATNTTKSTTKYTSLAFSIFAFIFMLGINISLLSPAIRILASESVFITVPRKTTTTDPYFFSEDTLYKTITETAQSICEDFQVNFVDQPFRDHLDLYRVSVIAKPYCVSNFKKAILPSLLFSTIPKKNYFHDQCTLISVPYNEEDSSPSSFDFSILEKTFPYLSTLYLEKQRLVATKEVGFRFLPFKITNKPKFKINTDERQKSNSLPTFLLLFFTGLTWLSARKYKV